jgi:hypothetical protein
LCSIYSLLAALCGACSPCEFFVVSVPERVTVPCAGAVWCLFPTRVLFTVWGLCGLCSLCWCFGCLFSLWVLYGVCSLCGLCSLCWCFVVSVFFVGSLWRLFSVWSLFPVLVLCGVCFLCGFCMASIPCVGAVCCLFPCERFAVPIL